MALVCACSSEVVADLDERQAQEALATLEGAGIPAERHATGEGRERRYRIDVPAKDAGRAAGVLRAQGLPRAPRRGFGELYGSASMIPTATEEKARYLEALGGEIAGHLEGLEGVLVASVIVTAPEDDPLAPPDAPRAHPTASVLVRLRPGAAAPAEDRKSVV